MKVALHVDAPVGSSATHPVQDVEAVQVSHASSDLAGGAPDDVHVWRAMHNGPLCPQPPPVHSILQGAPEVQAVCAAVMQTGVNHDAQQGDMTSKPRSSSAGSVFVPWLTSKQPL